MKLNIKNALIFIGAFSIYGCGIVSFINEYISQPLPKARVAKATTNLFVALDSDNGAYFSQTGESWIPIKIPENLKWNNLVAVNRKLFLVGLNGAVAASGDGLKWKLLPITDYRLWLMDLEYTYKLKKYLAVGIDGLTVMSNGLSNWSVNKVAYSTWFTSMVYGDGKIVVTGSRGEIFYTRDEIKWYEVNSGINSWLSKIKYIESNFYAVGVNGTIINSSDALSWHFKNSGTLNWLYDMIYFNGNIYVVGDKSTLLQCKLDETKCISVTNNLPRNTSIRTIDSNGKKIFIGGSDGLIASSIDGNNWSINYLNTKATIIKIVHLTDKGEMTGDQDYSD